MWTSDEWCVCYICSQPTADRDRDRGTDGDKRERKRVRERERVIVKKRCFFLLNYILFGMVFKLCVSCAKMCMLTKQQEQKRWM